MPFIRRIINKTGTTISITFSDNWTEHCDPAEKSNQEALIQALFVEFSRLLNTNAHDYILTSLTINETETYVAILSEKDNLKNVYRLELPRFKINIGRFEEKQVVNNFKLTLHDPLTETEKKIIAELGILEKTFLDWQEDRNRLLIFRPEDFAAYKKKFAALCTTFDSLEKNIPQELCAWFATDPIIQKIKKRIQKGHAIHQKMLQKQLELDTLALRLENLQFEYYEKHLQNKQNLFLLKARLLHILEETAAQYFSQLNQSDNIKSDIEKYFNDLFQGIAKIQKDNLQIKLNPDLYCLKEIADLFNAFLTRCNTFHNRAVSWSEPLSLLRVNIYYNSWIGVTTPLALLTQKIAEFPAEHKEPEYAIHYKYFKFGMPDAAYQLETETPMRSLAIKEEFSKKYSALLLQEHCEICDITLPSDWLLDKLPELMMSLAKHVEAKKAELAPPSPTTRIVQEVLTEIVEKVSNTVEEKQQFRLS